MQVEPEDANLVAQLEAMTTAEFDELPFGVIGFDDTEHVTVYSAHESRISGLDAGRVIGRRIFDEVAPCTNNFMVAERFREQATLDETLDYVFTLRMKPTPVRLRLLAEPSATRRYMIVMRRDAG